MESILGNVVWRFLRWLPSILLRCIFSPAWLSSHMYIDVRPRHSSVEVVHPDSPSVTVWLDVRNNTHFNVEIDRILLKLSYGSELASPNHLRRERLRPGESRSVCITGPIGYFQYKLLPFHHRNNSQNCRLEVVAECNTKLHSFCVNRSLDGIKPEIVNAHLLEVASVQSQESVDKAGASV